MLQTGGPVPIGGVEQRRILEQEEDYSQFLEIAGRLQELLLARSQSLEARTESLGERLGLTREEVVALRHPVRRRCRPLRDVLIYVLWRTTDYMAAQTSGFFSVGDTTISNAQVRGEKHVKLDRKLQRALRPLLEPSVE